VGDTLVMCVAMDAAGKTNQCSFLVQVFRDAEPPNIVCPNSRNVSCTGTNPTAVYFNVTASDNAGTSVMVSCTPPSGSGFPLGLTTVTCTATDRCGHSGQCGFPVIVQEPNVPSLSIEREGNRVVISWPATCAVSRLETTPSLGPRASWTPVNLTPINTPSGYSVSVEVHDTTGFYRLWRY
jgi:hypothetical protein